MSRPLPHDVELERALLGGLLLDPSQLATATDLCPVGDLHRPEHRHLLALLGELRERHGHYDLPLVASAVSEAGNPALYGGPLYVIELPNACPSVESIELHAERLAALATRRRGILALAEATERLYGSDDAAETLQTLSGRLAGLQTSVGGQVPRPIGEALRSHVDRVVGESIEREDAERAGLPIPVGGAIQYGFRALDALTGGIHPGNVSVLVGLPKMGKTSLALGVALNVARAGRTVVFYSYEMTADELLMRLICYQSGLDFLRCRSRLLHFREREDYERGASELAGLPIRLGCENPGLGQLRGQTRSVQIEEEGRNPLGLLVIDYLQLVPPPDLGRGANRENQVSALSRGIKRDVAKGLDVPVLLLSQVGNKQVEGRADRRILASDTRESGAIVMDCDNLIAVHREHVYNSDAPPNRGEVEVLVNRHGPTGKAVVGWRNGQWIDVETNPEGYP